MIKNHPMIRTLVNLRGNTRACVYTEPLWGIPFNLYMPYVSIYMSALGVSDSQIGFIASISLVFQIIGSLLSGMITDKLGRKRATMIFDVIGWSIPCLIWAFSQNFYYFLVAAIINSFNRVTMNSWGCLLVEDCDRSQIINIYAWVNISGLVAVFFAPITGLFIGKYDLVPTIRVVYLIAFVMMTAKFIILNKFATETRQGKIRMEETKNQSLFEQLSGYRDVLKLMFKSPETLLTLGIMLVMNICNLVNINFWSIMITQNLNIPEKHVGYFPFLRSFVMLVLFFVLVPKMRAIKFKKPLLVGFSTFIISQLLLILAPDKGYFVLFISIFLEACSLSLINPLMESMQVIMVDPKERARIIAMLYVIVIALSSPFGWIAGTLSEANRLFPFIMNIVLLLIGILFTLFASAKATERIAQQESAT